MPTDEITLESTLNQSQLGKHLVNSSVLGLKSRETPGRVERGKEVHRATYFEAFKKNLEEAIRGFEKVKSRDASNTDPHIIYHESRAILRALKHYKDDYTGFDVDRVMPIQEAALGYCARYESGYLASRFDAFPSGKLRDLAPKSEDVQSMFDAKEGLAHCLVTDLEIAKEGAVHETLQRLFVWLSSNYSSADSKERFDGDCNYPLPLIHRGRAYIIDLPMLPVQVQPLPTDSRYVLGIAGLSSPMVVVHFGSSHVKLKKASPLDAKEALQLYMANPASLIADYERAQAK